MRYIVFFLILIGLILTGCGSTGNMGDREVTFRSNLGTATEHDLRRKVPAYITRVSFTLYRDEVTLDGTSFETEWKDRDLFDDEREMGIVEARTKFIVSSRPRTAQATSLQTARIEIYNQVKIDGEEDWNRSIITDEARAYFRDIARRLEEDLRTGVRIN